MMKRISILLFTLTIAMLAFTLTLREVRRWRIMDAVQAADRHAAGNLPTERASQDSWPEGPSIDQSR
ncbi:MAG: hypothetical protein CO167_09865, partial [Candidatus Marinimicrobia bacterium CG_4_9_14_3_um_filter_48_9]